MKIWQPILAILCCHILTGTASVTTRYLVESLTPAEVACLRYLLGGAVLLPGLFVFRSKKLNALLVIKIVGLGMLFFGLFPFLFSWSFVHTTAARGSLVLATMPIWAMIINHLIGHEKINALLLLAVAVTLLGLTLTLADKLFVTSDTVVSFKGELIMMAAAIVGAIYAIFSRGVLRQATVSTMTPMAMLSGCLCLLPFNIAYGIDDHIMVLSPLQIGLVVYLGVVTGGVAFFLFNWALNKSTASFTTLFVALNPITAIFLGYIFLNETIHTNFIVGVAVVFTGLCLAVKSQIVAHRQAT